MKPSPAAHAPSAAPSPARGRRGRARWPGAAATGRVATAVGLGLCELVARSGQASGLARVYRFSPERIYEPIPDSVKVFKRRREGAEALTIPLRFNGLGLRGPDPDPDDDRPRVVVFGDSFIEGRYVVEEETFAARLEAALGERDRPAQVWNAGLAGYGPDQSLLRLEAELPRLDPDLVVFAVFAGNDFGDLLRNKLFRIGADGLERGVPVFTQELRRSFDAPRGLALGHMIRRRFGPTAPLLEDVQPVGSDRLERILSSALRSAREEFDELQRGDLRVHLPFRDLYDADLSLEPRSPSALAKAALMEGVLSAVAERARAAEVELLFVFIPHLLDACPAGLLAEDGVDTERWPDYSPSSKTDLLSRIAEGTGTPYLDLWPPFRERCDEGLYFTKVDDHWNARGQAVAAELCAEAILAGGLLE